MTPLDVLRSRGLKICWHLAHVFSRGSKHKYLFPWTRDLRCCPPPARTGSLKHETDRRIRVIKKGRASQPYRWGLMMRRTSFHRCGLSLFVVLVAVESAVLAQTVPTRRQRGTYPQQTVSVAVAPTATTSTGNSNSCRLSRRLARCWPSQPRLRRPPSFGSPGGPQGDGGTGLPSQEVASGLDW